MPLKNQVFSTLVQGEEDTLGMIAYSFYKLHKREYCSQFEQSHHREPSAEDWDHFALGMTPAQLDNYRHRANKVLESFLESAVGEAINEQVNELQAQYSEQLEFHMKARNEMLANLNIIAHATHQISEQIKPRSYWYGVSQGVMASVLFVFLIGVFAFLLRVLKVDVIGIARAIGEWAGNVSAP